MRTRLCKITSVKFWITPQVLTSKYVDMLIKGHKCSLLAGHLHRKLGHA